MRKGIDNKTGDSNTFKSFERTDSQKISRIKQCVSEIMETLGLDLSDDSLKGTPLRVAKSYVNELFRGLNPENKPKHSTFYNKFSYGEMLVEKNIRVHSTCEHHLLPIEGRAHVGYISSGRIIGLSKINRIVDYFSRRPQVQERLTMQIVKDLQTALGTDSVACVIDAKHTCVNSRGVNHVESSTITSDFRGKFKETDIRLEFLGYIRDNSKL